MAMGPSNIPFQVTDWDKLPTTVVNGSSGTATVRIQQLGDLRIRMIEYSANYRADHWCRLGHLVFVLEGELISELESGAITVLKAGSSYAVSDGLSSHRSRTVGPVKLLIVDGGFLK
ncbi:MAG TPA: DHCW motif cupin fold protein [Flavobacteriales bacterium]|nr:DHCW motif cupin fold protein [Flavobacteriales bacterium]